jgi:hypothetical protein
MSNPLTNVAFIAYLKRMHLFPINPDEQDFNPATTAHTPEEQADQYAWPSAERWHGCTKNGKPRK